MLSAIKQLFLTIFLFLDAEIRSLLGLAIPALATTTKKRNLSSSSFSIHRRNDGDGAKESFTENHVGKNHHHHINKLRKNIDATLQEQDNDFQNQWKNELPLPVCFLLFIHHFFVSRAFFFSKWLVPQFFADFVERALVHFMSAFAVSSGFFAVSRWQ